MWRQVGSRHDAAEEHGGRALCKEPMPEMMELDKATWAEGDFNNEPPAEGKEVT
jgi:hypothetical protein